MSKYGQLSIQLFDGLLDEWGDDGDELLICNVSLSDIQKKVPLIERGQSVVLITRDFLQLLLSKNHPESPSDAKQFQRDISTAFNPIPDIYHPADRYPSKVFRFETYLCKLNYCQICGAAQRNL